MNSLTFNFDSYELKDGNNLVFHYSYSDIGKNIASFAERYLLPPGDVDINDQTTQYILQQLHIIVGISYYKSLLGQTKMPYALNKAEADYWNTIYDNGLREYAFVNKINAPITPFTATTEDQPVAKPLSYQGALLGVGGGKDSIVASEILRGIAVDTTTMDVATRDNHGQAGAVMDIIGWPQVRVGRYLDTSIVDFTANHNGNHGHIPLSAVLAWVGILIAHINHKKYVVMANEASTSIGNTTWKNKEVNHQWSKSFEFEQLTQIFLHSNISPDMHYFSPLRPYGSLAIMELLVQLGNRYFEYFTSCNLVLRIDPAMRPNGRWCTHCAKCLSTWLLLSAWLPTTTLEKIFGRNLFQDSDMQPLLRTLLGLKGHKPLDCVGTIEELRAVTRKALQSDTHIPLLNGILIQDIPGPEIDMLIHEVAPDNIPEELKANIKAFVDSKL